MTCWLYPKEREKKFHGFYLPIMCLILLNLIYASFESSSTTAAAPLSYSNKYLFLDGVGGPPNKCTDHSN